MRLRLMSGERKKQHYVPQFYLKEFCEEDEIVHCFDKMEGRCYPRARTMCLMNA
jgi:hypothetical protein